MLAVRLHLDHCDGGNGPLKVIPGSHRQARLSERQTELWKSSGKPVMCTVPSGGALVMRPLLLHSSSKATTPGQRRVLHLEFAAVDLPVPLEWHERERCPAAG
jgi:ectoine hydroxylase-related dioxygenase (phytanoyl-CoA dioxygenase family)